MDRRKMLALLGASPVLVADSPAYARTAPKNESEHAHVTVTATANESP